MLISARENIADALKKVVKKIEVEIKDSGRNIRAVSQSCSWFNERIEDFLVIIRVIKPDNITEDQAKSALEIESDISNADIGQCNSAQKEKLLEYKQECEDMICKFENTPACNIITSTTTTITTTSSITTYSTTTTTITTTKTTTMTRTTSWAALVSNSLFSWSR